MIHHNPYSPMNGRKNAKNNSTESQLTTNYKLATNSLYVRCVVLLQLTLLNVLPSRLRQGCRTSLEVRRTWVDLRLVLVWAAPWSTKHATQQSHQRTLKYQYDRFRLSRVERLLLSLLFLKMKSLEWHYARTLQGHFTESMAVQT